MPESTVNRLPLKGKEILERASSAPLDADKLAAMSGALQEYATCFRFAEWLIDNNVLATDTTVDTRPEALAYSYAIRFNHQRAALAKLIGEPH